MSVRTGPGPLFVEQLSAAAYAVYFGVKVAWDVYHPPTQLLDTDPGDHGMPYETWQWQTSRDNVHVEGWFVEGTGPHGAVVQHGVGRNRAETLRQVKLLHEEGFHVLTVDMRNHGSSGRCRNVTGMSGRYTSDLLDALTRLRADNRVTGSLGCLAMSFSTWPAVCAGASPQAARLGLTAIVCDSGPVPDIKQAITRFATALSMREERLGTSLSRRLVRAVAPTTAAAILAVRHWPETGCNLPVLLITGGRDRLLPPEEVTSMVAFLPDASTWFVPKASHLGAVTSDSDGYKDRVSTFFRDHGQSTLHQVAT